MLMAKKLKKVPVGQRAIIQRINRKLPKFQQLRKLRGTRWLADLGEFYIIDHNRNTIVDAHVNLEKLARKLDALSPSEALVNE